MFGKKNVIIEVSKFAYWIPYKDILTYVADLVQICKNLPN